MKHIIKLILPAVAAIAATSANAQPLLKLSEDAHLHFIGDLSFVYDDNLLLWSEGNVSDSYVVFSPGLELRLLQEGSASAVLRYQHEFLVHQDYDEFDDDFSDLDFAVSYDSGVLMANGYVRYRESYSRGWELDQIGDISGDLIKRDQFGIGGSLKYELSQLTAIKAGIDYSETDYKDDRYVGNDDFSIPVTYYYQVRPNVDLTAGIRYRNTQTTNANEFDDWYYYIGAVGELFSPVVTADLTIGYQNRENKLNNADTGSATYNLSFIYTGNPKIVSYLTLSQDYRTSAVGGASYVFSSASLGSSYAISSTVGVNGSIAFGQSDYDQITPDAIAREEDTWILRLGASYRPNDYFTVNAFYNYRDVDGNFLNYSQNEISVTASLRY